MFSWRWTASDTPYWTVLGILRLYWNSEGESKMWLKRPRIAWTCRQNATGASRCVSHQCHCPNDLTVTYRSDNNKLKLSKRQCSKNWSHSNNILSQAAVYFARTASAASGNLSGEHGDRAVVTETASRYIAGPSNSSAARNDSATETNVTFVWSRKYSALLMSDPTRQWWTRD